MAVKDFIISELKHMVACSTCNRIDTKYNLPKAEAIKTFRQLGWTCDNENAFCPKCTRRKVNKKNLLGGNL